MRPFFLHLTSKAVHHFQEAVGVSDCCPLATKSSQIPIPKGCRQPQEFCSLVSTIDRCILYQNDMGDPLRELHIKRTVLYVYKKRKYKFRCNGVR